MPPLNLVVVNAAASLEGDVNMLLVALEHLDPAAFRVTAVSIPRGAAYEHLRARYGVHTIPMELGGVEGRTVGRARRLAEIANALRRIAALPVAGRADVLVSLDRTVSARLASASSWLTGTPFVLSAHYPLYPAGGPLNRAVLRSARRIVAHSEFLASRLRPFVSGDDRIVIVPNAVELERYVPDRGRDELRREHGIDPATPLVVMAGRLSRFKGQDDLIEAAAIIARVRPDVRFVIAGHDTNEVAPGSPFVGYRPHLEQLIAERGLGTQVRLAGYVADLPTFIGAGDITAMPSWEEPFGLVALEAMAMARPVVATRAGGVPEFVIDREHGLLVPPRDPQALAGALLELLADPELARELGRRGRRRVELAHTAERYSATVGRVLYDAVGRTVGA
jgi:glycosyltransferase involved in cell wall biosynthesis